MTYESQIRATFEDTFKNQEILRKKLDELQEQNRGILTKIEQDEMFELLSRSTLGLGTESVIMYLPNGQVVDIKNLEKFVAYMFYNRKNMITQDFFLKLGIKTPPSNIEIKYLWEQIKIHLFGVFPLAKAAAIRISKEQKKTGSGRGYYVGPRNNTGIEEEI